jgi:predicted nucleic acid-binding Zn ribbon protein
MPVYVYETMHARAGQRERFELRQGMLDPALTHHPVTGKPVRRVITGGLGVVTVRTSSRQPARAAASGNCCPGCH